MHVQHQRDAEGARCFQRIQGSHRMMRMQQRNPLLLREPHDLATPRTECR